MKRRSELFLVFFFSILFTSTSSVMYGHVTSSAKFPLCCSEQRAIRIVDFFLPSLGGRFYWSICVVLECIVLLLHSSS